ncbi:MAG: alpha-amylase family glycosyl hydrolase [Acidobacteriota bacterium]
MYRTINFARIHIWRGLTRRSATALLIGIVLSLYLMTSFLRAFVAGDPPKVIDSAPCLNPPTIDGVLGEGEWAEATTVKFDMSMIQLQPLAVKEDRSGELRVMNTANALYVVLRVPDPVEHKSLDPVETDLASLAFCQGKEVASGDDRKVIIPGFYVDKHVTEPGKDEDDSQQDGQGAVGYERGFHTFEWSVPLGSKDSKDLMARLGDQVRFNIAFIDRFRTDLKDTLAGGLYGPDLDHAINWGVLRLAADAKEEKAPALKSYQTVEFEPYKGSGPGAWPVKGALYEVCPENYPQHSLREITADIPRLKEVGITVIYLTPIFSCLGNAQYLINDYDAINPRYGAEEDLKNLVTSAHREGIKVLLDLVTSLTYDGTKIMKEHPDWVLRGKDGQRQRYYPIPEFGWALDCMNPEVIAYFSGVARRYVVRFDIDGWRVDSPTNNYDPAKVDGDHSRTQLLRAVRKAVDSVKTDSIFVAEVSGPTVLFGGKNASLEPLFDEMIEASYDFRYSGFLGPNGYFVPEGMPLLANLKPAPLNALAQNQMTSKQFVNSIVNRRIINGRLRANFIENHDTERVSKVFPKQHRNLFAMIATVPGIPVVHCGQEIGSTVHPDVSGKVAVVDWANGDLELQAFYSRVLKARARNAALTRGDMRDIWMGGDPCIAYLRSAEDNRVIVALNFDAKPVKSKVRVSLVGNANRVVTLVDEITGDEKRLTAGDLANLSVDLAPYGCRIFSIRLGG